MNACDVLLLGPHPDDVEIACAGTILQLVAAGRRVSVLDLTRGEMGSRGTAAERGAEAAAASALLGLHERHNLGLPDTQLQPTPAHADQLVAALRSARPQLLLCPHAHDPHPDHVAAAELATRACFLAGLRNHRAELGAPFRPALVIRYPGNIPVEPTFVVDITTVAERKAEVIRCYRSQLAPPDRKHLTQGLDVLERALVRDRFFGARIATAAAEPFVVDGPLPLRGLHLLMTP